MVCPPEPQSFLPALSALSADRRSMAFGIGLIHCDKELERRGVIMTVLASLRTRFPRFTLEHLLSEVQRWCAEGRSIFESELAELRKAAAPPSGQPIPIPSV